MKRIKDNTRDQGILFSEHYVGDRLSPKDEVFLFEQLFDKLDIREITNAYSPEGGSMFSPRDQLAVILFAFQKGITSSVKIAELIRYNLQFIYLAGGHIIKRRTISDFRLKHIESIRKLLNSTTRLALDSGLISPENIFALDGSKIEANASFAMTRKKNEWKNRQKQIIDHVDKFLDKWAEQDKLEENAEEEELKRFNEISERLNKIKKQDLKKNPESEDSSEKNESGHEKSDEDSSAEKKESSAIVKKNRIKINETDSADKYLTEYEKIDSLLDQYDEADDNMLLSLTDPDCRVMKSDSITKECYNVQAISNNQIIVALDVTQDENDQAQLKPMIEQLKQNLNIKEQIKLAADAGYNRGKNLAYIDKENSIDAYISMYDRSEKNNAEEISFHKENFIYDEDSDNWKCPSGASLEFIKEFFRDDKKIILYGCNLKTCIYCPHVKSCVTTKADTKRGFRTIEDDGYVVYRKEMKAKMQKLDSKKIYSKRSSEIEAVFGQIKNNRGFSRFRLRGLRKVRGECMIMAVAHNIGKIMKNLSRMNQTEGCLV